MMPPPFCLYICRSAARVVRNAPSRWVASIMRAKSPSFALRLQYTWSHDSLLSAPLGSECWKTMRYFRQIRQWGFAAGTLAASTLLRTTTAMGVVATSGGATIEVQDRSDTAPFTSSATAFIDLPDANVLVTVPTGVRRLIGAHFTAESKCTSGGNVGGWCSVRIIATSIAGGRSVELNPASGLDFAFDSEMPSKQDDLWEAHAMDRSILLSPGAYRIRVQNAVSDNNVTFTLDDWHFRVEINE